MNTSAKASTNKIAAEHPVPLTAKSGYPILWWAGLGAVVLFTILSAYGQWILSADFKPSPTGDDPISSGTLMLMRSLEVAMPLAAAWFWWAFLIKPWRDTGHITWDGIFVLVCATIWFQDPIDNYFNFTFSYNAHFFNRASWAMYIPGWEAPRQNLFAEPIFFMGGMFMWLFFGGAIFGCWFLRNAKCWWPTIGFPTSMLLLFAAFFVADFAAEVFLCRTGLFGYPGAYHALTLWAGTPQQFPLYESSSIASVCLVVTCFRYFRDDKGQSFVERGMERLRLSRSGKSFLSFLALLAGIHLAVWVCFYLPYTWFALKADSFPKMPSYMTMEICGEGTAYACPSREVPIPSRNSLAITPDDPRLSSSARRN